MTGEELAAGYVYSLRAVSGRRRGSGGEPRLLIETSDRSRFWQDRQFYRKRGQSEVARISDFFSNGDGQRRSLSASDPGGARISRSVT